MKTQLVVIDLEMNNINVVTVLTYFKNSFLRRIYLILEHRLYSMLIKTIRRTILKKEVWKTFFDIKK